MPDIESALAKLEAALDRAEAVVNSAGNGGSEVESLRTERDELASQVALLRDNAEEDAKLRAEAAEAVKSALSDLRGLVQHEERVANA